MCLLVVVVVVQITSLVATCIFGSPDPPLNTPRNSEKCKLATSQNYLLTYQMWDLQPWLSGLVSGKIYRKPLFLAIEPAIFLNDFRNLRLFQSMQLLYLITGTISSTLPITAFLLNMGFKQTADPTDNRQCTWTSNWQFTDLQVPVELYPITSPVIMPIMENLNFGTNTPLYPNPIPMKNIIHLRPNSNTTAALWRHCRACSCAVCWSCCSWSCFFKPRFGPMGDLNCLMGRGQKKTTEVWIVDDQEEKGYDRGMTNMGHVGISPKQACNQHFNFNIDLINRNRNSTNTNRIQPALETPASILLALWLLCKVVPPKL